MRRRTLIKQLGLAVPAIMLGRHALATGMFGESMKSIKGPFTPDWASLQKYTVPDWFRDAKLGLWAHWGPQCQPEAGDWYAREMYMEGSRAYKYHLEKYGHPSVFGFKDVINEWKAEKWNPEELVALYKQIGAKYFVAMGNHHDNFDMFDSKYQPDWNSTKIGPKKDILAGWAKAAKDNDLPFGVSFHAAHAWSWYETSQRADKKGDKAGVSYDGNITKADGKGKWWEGLDPQELYAQNHPLSEKSEDNMTIHRQWDWGNGVTPPSINYIKKFYKRTIEVVDKFKPDFIYFDDSQLPFWPINDSGLRIASYMYNKSIKDFGENQAVVAGKILNKEQRKAMVWDIERGHSNDIEPLPWQADSCIGVWHYDRSIYDRKRYKTAKTVIHNLIDIVSKNGNLLLSIPVRGDGSIDELELQIVEEIGVWMNANGDSIYATRPWKVFGEGPAQKGAAELSAQGFNEGRGKPYTSEDIRFATKGDILFATVMEWPESGNATIKSLAEGSTLYPEKINRVEMVSNNQSLSFSRTNEGLVVNFPESKPTNSYAIALKII
jgi:alpha-L-fucosidase